MRHQTSALSLALLLAAAATGCDGGSSTPTCDTAETLCGTQCIDTTSDARHCGACGTACAVGEICSDGACEAFCPAGQTECVGGCFTLDASPEHCGACGNACETGEACFEGACTVACPGSLTACGGTCRDFQTDESHCGACGNACGEAERCVSGECELTCSDNLTRCGDACRDTRVDPANCGACGNACGADETCLSGTCMVQCPPGQSVCDGACRDTATDRAHCGACGTACDDGELCVNSVCTLSCTGFANTVCDGACTNTQVDPSNCGTCGNACPAGEVCSAGSCAGSCPSGADLCGGACTDTSFDPSNCGNCGIACTAAANAVPVCAAGTCASVCQAGYGDCNADLSSSGSDGCEAALMTSITHCGACGTACAAPANATAACTAGSCGLGTCNTGYANCDGLTSTGCEAHLASDNAHCGACNNACSASQVCTNGACVQAVPGGESCADPLDLVAGANVVDWNALTNDYLLTTPTCVTTGTIAGPDVVLRYVAPFTGFVEFAFPNKPTSNRWVSVVSDAPCGTLTPMLACISDWSPAFMSGTMSMTAGTTYYLYVADTSSGGAPLNDPLDVVVTETNCASYNVAIQSLSPANGASAITFNPQLVVTFDGPIDNTTGQITVTGSQGNSATFTVPASQVVFSTDRRTITINHGLTFANGEQVTVSWSGLMNGLCGSAVPSPTWSFTAPSPSCTPGTGGTVGTTQTRFPTGLTSHTEYYVAPDWNPNGWVYYGGLTSLYRMPKAGGASQVLYNQNGISSGQTGYTMLVHGQNIFTVDSSTSKTTDLLWRISSDGGATFFPSPQNMATFPQTPADDFVGVAQHGDRVFLVTNEGTASVNTEIWSVDVSGATPAPALAVLERSFGANEYNSCRGLAVDAQNFYTICRLGSGSNHPVLRISRTTGATTELAVFPGNTTAGELHMRDQDADGVADVLYARTNQRETYYVCGPATASPFGSVHVSFTGSSTTSYGLGYDPVANALWAYEDLTTTGSGQHELIRIQ